MHPSEAADSLRMRYRHDRPNQTVERRPVQPTVHARPHSTQAVRPVPRRVAAKPLDVSIDNVAAAPQKHYKYLVKPRRLEHVLLVAMAVALFAMGGYISFGGMKANQEITEKTKQLSSTSSSGAAVVPVADKPTNDSLKSYTVAADMPRYISIPSLKTQARVKSVGVDAKGHVVAPSNVYDAAWFNQTAKPGNDGAAFINGHVSSWTSNGVFYNLTKASPGMLIEMERGDGTKLTYKVVKTQTYKADAVDMNAAVNTVTPGKQGLNIMTCTGKVIKGTSEFDSRLLVMAERVS